MCYLCKIGLLSLHNFESEVIRKNEDSLIKNTNNNRQGVASVEIKHLVMSTQDVSKRLILADKEREL